MVNPQTIRPVLAIAWTCILRVVLRVRYHVAVAVAAALVAFGALQASTIQASDGKALGLSVGIAFALRGMSLLPLVLPLVAGDLLAEDIRGGYVWLQETRGASPQQMVWGHALGYILIAMLASASIAGAGVAAGLLLLPQSVGPDPARVFPFAPGLLASSPAWHVVLMAALYGLAGFALLIASAAIGAWTGNGLGASLSAPLFVLAAGILLPVQAQAINPLERVMFANTWDAAWASPDAVASYWVVVAGIALLTALVGLQRRGARA